MERLSSWNWNNLKRPHLDAEYNTINQTSLTRNRQTNETELKSFLMLHVTGLINFVPIKVDPIRAVHQVIRPHKITEGS